MSDLIARAEAWLSRLRPCDTGANGPMFTRLLIEELKKREYVNDSDRKDAERYRYLRAANRIMPGTPGTRPIEWYLGTVADEKIDAAIAESNISPRSPADG